MLREGAGGEGTPLYKPYRVCAAPKGSVLTPFWSENGYGFRGNNVFIVSIPNE